MSNPAMITAIEAVARQFSAAWEAGEGPPDAWLTIAGKRIALELVAMHPLPVDLAAKARPRLRFDKVAVRLVAALQAGLREAVPDGITLAVTVTAPIRLPARTAATLEDKVRRFLAQTSAPAEFHEVIHANQVHVRLLSGSPFQTPRVIGFVHNPDGDPRVLLDMTQAWLECFGTALAGRPVANPAGDRWLAVVDPTAAPHVDSYRHIASRLSVPAGFNRILLVFAGDRVATLAG